MRRKNLSGAQRIFVEQVRAQEERLFAAHLDAEDASRVKSERYSWHYRPSHHAATGLVMQQDIAFLAGAGKGLLSVGAHPALLEQVLCAFGVPAAHILAADNDPAIMRSADVMEKAVFDAIEPWPELGTFDLILFPESLCIFLADRIREEGARANLPVTDAAFPTDAREAELLAVVLREAYLRLRSGGEIRANGPMSHPNVVRAASALLHAAGCVHVIDYRRYFLTLRLSTDASRVQM